MLNHSDFSLEKKKNKTKQDANTPFSSELKHNQFLDSLGGISSGLASVK